MWDKGEEAVTKGEIVMKKENYEFNSDEARVSRVFKHLLVMEISIYPFNASIY